MIKIDCNLIYERIKIKGSLDLGSRFIYENVFVILVLFAWFCFLNNKLKISYRSEKIKRRHFVATLDRHKDH